MNIRKINYKEIHVCVLIIIFKLSDYLEPASRFPAFSYVIMLGVKRDFMFTEIFPFWECMNYPVCVFRLSSSEHPLAQLIA